ncbi:MAG: molecular chaperone TorD family protein [Deltaproteobacteria bacterium]|nr:molecular chaperone TorD family protein [Deltaproteobacteria bacterium]MBW1812351.1 molecular chaperone TorD family protein [Deltaproteobacteria bacterium]MBW1846940.1 molecular chaperone TorD family protein [Deltaproteobacteria bacterium]MBW2182127.1 molecular chaperone TorD family protein [Deltaproteobacteria bacterium]MBW2363644.1 molecular chaperone TorD family protein [Deltaproteobacteria bacterium]
MNIDDLLMRETSRRDVYKALSFCFYLPDDNLELTTENLEGHLITLNTKAVTNAKLMRSECQNDKCLEALTIDFARLFVGPFQLLAPPYGSVYLEGERKIMGDSTVDVIERYREVGLDISKQFKDAPDHIAAELEFMHVLICLEISALQDGIAEDIQKFIHRQRAFLNDHLGAWIRPFTELVTTHAQTGFYRNLAQTTKLFIDEEFDELLSLGGEQK